MYDLGTPIYQLWVTTMCCKHATCDKQSCAIPIKANKARKDYLLQNQQELTKIVCLDHTKITEEFQILNQLKHSSSILWFSSGM